MPISGRRSVVSRQFEHLQESSAERLRAFIPVGCPLLVGRAAGGGFRAWTLDERDEITGRYQVVAAWVTGYVAAWMRVRQPTTQAIGHRLS